MGLHLYFYQFSNAIHYLPDTAVAPLCISSCWTDASDNSLVQFMNACSGLVNRGCPSLTCPAGVVDAAPGRLKNSQIALAILNKAHIQNPHAQSLLDIIDYIEDDFKQQITRTYGGQGMAPISTYDFAGFKKALTTVIIDGLGKNKDKFFDASNSSPSSMRMAKINLACFLGQSMQETLQYGACDENNWTEGEAVDMGAGICRNIPNSERL